MMAGVPYGDPTDPANHDGSADQRKAAGEGRRLRRPGSRRGRQGRPRRAGSPSTCRRVTTTSRPCSSAPTRTPRSPRRSSSVRFSSSCRTTATTTPSGSPTTPIFGLSGAVLSADHDRALAVARRIRTGTISVNGGMCYGPDSPFGGYKQSGIGREMGAAEHGRVPRAQDAGRARWSERAAAIASSSGRTGNIGGRALREVIRHPDLDLVGVLVYDPAKAGVDAGTLCGEKPVGVAADHAIRRRSRDLGADCVLYMPAARPRGRRRPAGSRHATSSRRAVRSSAAGSRLGDDRQHGARRLHARAARRSTRPAAAPDSSPTRCPSRCFRMQRRVDSVEIDEYANLSRRDSPHMIFQQMGFGSRRSVRPTRRRAQYLLGEFGPALGALAEAAGRPVDRWDERRVEVAVARQTTVIAAGEIAGGYGRRATQRR